MQLEYTYLGITILSAFALYFAYLTVRGKDLVYSSVSLALTASLVSLIVAFMGFHLVAIVQLLVYVGAAVMFIIISVSLLGAKETTVRNEYLGLTAGIFTLTVLAIYLNKLYTAFTFAKVPPASVISDLLLSRYMSVLVLIIVALAATIIEAISLAKR
jgi:NADH-quinone oxidoreductase subunit J